MSMELYLNGMKKEEVAIVWIMHAPKGSGKPSLEFGYRMGEEPHPFKQRPVWMTEFKKTWDNPSEPVTFEFTLSEEGHAQEALNYLYNEPVTREP